MDDAVWDRFHEIEKENERMRIALLSALNALCGADEVLCSTKERLGEVAQTINE